MNVGTRVGRARKGLGHVLALCGVPLTPALAQNVDYSMLGPFIQEQVSQRYLTQEMPDVFEKWGSQYRDGREHTIDGEMKLTYFYRGFMDQVTRGVAADFLQSWRQRFPTSPAPDVIAAQARLLEALGPLQTSFEQPLSPTTFVIDTDALSKARQFLRERKDRAASDPTWYVLMARADIALHEDEDKFLALIREGLGKHPESLDIAVAGADYFLPKWYGNADKLEQYARSAVEMTKQVHASAAYAKVYARAFQLDYQYSLFKRSRIDWPTMKNATSDLLAFYPGTANLNLSAAFACMAGDRGETRKRFAMPGFRMHFSFWLGQDYYNVCKAWASKPEERKGADEF